MPTGTITLLFTDIEGSTLLLQQLGERYAEMLATCRQLLRTAFQHWNGFEVDTQGDAFFVVFARASDAISAVIDIQRALASHDWPNGAAVALRIGLHTGEPTPTAEGYIGLDVHHAARIMSVGHGGQVLLSQTTHELVKQNLPEEVSLRDLGEHRLKDLQRPAHLYQLSIADLPADFPPLKTLDNSPNNLPIQPTSLIGREKEVVALFNILQREEVRLLTLTGPGGTGKTRLGLQVAAELSDLFPDGVYFVNLAPLSDPTLVVPTIAQTLDVKEVTEQPLLDLLKGALHWKHLLLLLDNFEQVVDAAMDMAVLLAVCPNLKVMVTSRMTLHIRGEQEFPVPPLEVPDPKHLPNLVALSHYEAVELFLARAQAVEPEFQLSSTNAPAIAEICARLDGLPLAIELAAARIKLLPPQALLARLGQRLTVLTGGAKDVPARQQTLRNTIEWSYQLLDAQEQQLFRRLSAFVDGCTLEAIEAVCDARDNKTGAVSVLDGVASLIDKSFLQQTEQEGEQPRLVMLETIREYGLELLETSGEMEAMRQAHAEFYLQLAEEAEPKLGGLQQAVWLERLEQELDNLRAALWWLLEREEVEQSIEMALRLAGALQRFWEVHGHWSEGRDFLERALSRSKGAAAPVQVKALKAAAHLAFIQRDIDRAEALFEESLTRCRELGDTAGIALSLRLLGLIAWRRYNFVMAISLTEQSLALFREVGHKEGIAWSLSNLASLVGEQGEYARAISLTEESLALFRALGNLEGIAFSLFGLADILFISQGDPSKVHTLLQEGLAVCREMGHKDGLAWGLCLLGQVFLQQGDSVKARSLLEESMLLYRGLGNRNIAWFLILLARTAASEGDKAAARAIYEESMAIGREVGFYPYDAFHLEGLADVVAAQGDLVWAAQIWGLAEALREAMGVPIPPVERASHERSVSAARAQVGEKAFAAAWVEGRMMIPEQALAAQGKVMIPSWQTSATPVKPPTSPAGLTVRELDVLRLLAQGLTDAQIAEQLVLSLHTIHAHLRTIYSKLGVTSRSAATRYAFEHQLV
jgi:predicted ATPase/class 3 adenylate cyclase/DNA-binding CsgD family transcriptional regulator